MDVLLVTRGCCCLLAVLSNAESRVGVKDVVCRLVESTGGRGLQFLVMRCRELLAWVDILCRCVGEVRDCLMERWLSFLGRKGVSGVQPRNCCLSALRSRIVFLSERWVCVFLWSL